MRKMECKSISFLAIVVKNRRDENEDLRYASLRKVVPRQCNTEPHTSKHNIPARRRSAYCPKEGSCCSATTILKMIRSMGKTANLPRMVRSALTRLTPGTIKGEVCHGKYRD